MSVPRIKILIREKGVPKQLVGKALTRILKATMQDTGRSWHSEVLPLHFDPQAHRVYGYRERSPGWVKRKRMRGIREQLVWTGNMRAQMVHRRKVSGSSKKVRVRVPAPPHLHFHNKDDEVGRLSSKDEALLQKAGDAALQKNLDEVVDSMQEEIEEITR